MNRTLLGLAVVAVVVGATVARADDDDHEDCGPMPTYAPRGQSYNQGQYQLQTTQVWVPGQQQQVWVPGQCHHRGPFQLCTQGYYQTVVTEGRYESQQHWVWVANSYGPRPHHYGRQYGRDYGRGRWGRGHRATAIDF